MMRDVAASKSFRRGAQGDQPVADFFRQRAAAAGGGGGQQPGGLGLCPRQVAGAPAVDCVAVSVFVEVAFKPFQNVVGAIAGFGGAVRGEVRPRAAATDKQRRGVGIEEFLQFFDKAGVDFHGRIGLPFDKEGVRDAPDIGEFRRGADVDDLGGGGGVKVVGFVRQNRAGVGEFQTAAVVVRRRKKCCRGIWA